MQKIIFYSLFFIPLLFSLSTKADKKNVLFLGNSYTYFNDLPKMCNDVANSLGDTVTHESNTPGGYTAQQHAADATSLSKIAQGNWDYVSMHCQSQEPSFSPGQVSTNTYPYVKYLDSVIQATNTCAETLYFMTWGRKNGDASNCANYPPICTYDGMQQRLRESYLLFADSMNASVSPVGAAWKKMRDTHPTVDLYNADESHPSVNGTYLAACVFYCTLFKKSCVGSQYLPVGVANGDAFYMQQIAGAVVLDSLENWQEEGSIPDAAFVGGTWPGSGSAAAFTNNSKRFATSAWDFGDGSPIDNTTNPNHVFPNSIGTYSVCLTVSSACGKKDSTCQTIMVNPSSTSSYSQTDKIKIAQSENLVMITNEYGNCQMRILDTNGREVYSEKLQNGNTRISTSSFAKGIYVLKIEADNELLKIQKLFNY